MLLAYRIVYFIIVVLFLVNVPGTEYVGVVPPATVVLKMASAVALCANLVLVVAFSRVQPAIFWIAILVWQVLFVWYAWLSPGAPFTVVLRDRVLAGILFAVLSAWFCSLPFVRSLRPHRQLVPARVGKVEPPPAGE